MKVFNKLSNKREMWVSNNRVLVGGSKKITGRNPNFDTDETRLLISLWGDPKIQKTLITTHKKHAVISRLAEKMRDYGYQRSAEEINTRIKNLKCFYNRIKKDLESGSNTEPTWKHYGAMDEIMTRPIFSVRPNEIPKPSLRYKLEEAKREREERGETLDEIEEAELMKTLQGNRSNNDSENGSETRNFSSSSKNIKKTEDLDNESDMDEDDNDTFNDEDNNLYEDDMDYEPIISINSDSNNNNNGKDDKSSSSTLRLRSSRKNDKKKIIEDSQQSAQLQNINQNSIDIEESSIIKDEPIDIDDDSNDEKPGDNKGSDIQPASDFTKPNANINSNSTMNLNKIITTIAASLSSSPNVITTTSSPLKIGHATSLVGMSSSGSISTINTNTNTQAKISLVPTNFLLKPQSQQIQPEQPTTKPIKTNSIQGLQINRQIPIRPKPSQSRIIYTHPTTGQQTTNGIVNTSNGPMKVLLVNTLQKNGQNVQNVVTPNGTILQNKSMDMQNSSMYQPSTSALQTSFANLNEMPQTTSVNLNGLVSSTSNEKLNILRPLSSAGKTAVGYRALLTQLVRTQEEANLINRERLHLERAKFEYEKCMGDKLMSFLPGLLPNILGLFQQKDQQSQEQPIIPEKTMTNSTVAVAEQNTSIDESSNINKPSTSPLIDKPDIKDDTTTVLLTPKIEKEDQ